MSNDTSAAKEKAAKAAKYYSDTPKTGVHPESLLQAARLELMMKFPFFGKVAMNMAFIETDMVPTTAVDAKGNFYYNPKWVNGFTREDALFEMGHEVMHLVQRLWSRKSKGIIHSIWNKAADYHADTSLIEAKLEQSAISKEMVGPAEQQLTRDHDTVNKLYIYLLKQAEQNTDCQACKQLIKQIMQMGKKQKQQNEAEDKQGQEKSQGSGESGQQPGGDQPGEPGDGEDHSHGDGEPCDHSHGGHGDGEGEGEGQGQGQGGDSPEHTCDNIRLCCAGVGADVSNMDANDIQKWTEIVVGAKIHAQGKGNMPAALGEYIDSLVKSKVKWQDYLRTAATRIFGKSRYTVKRPNRRGPAIGLRIPAKTPDGYTAVLVFDTSASMSCEEVRQCLSEGKEILRVCGCQKIWVIMHDMRVYFSGWVQDADFTNLKMARGGTSHQEVFQILDRSHKNEDFNIPREHEVTLAVMFTDLGTDFPRQAPDYEVFWGVPSNGSPGMAGQVPFGKKIEVEMK